MVGVLDDYVLDNGLGKIDTESTNIMICAAEPTAYSLCSIGAANSLGYKQWSQGGAFGAPAAGSPNGRKVSSTVVSDGTILTAGTANWWAVIDSTGGRRQGYGTLSASQVVASGNTFSLASFDIRIPSQ